MKKAILLTLSLCLLFGSQIFGQKEIGIWKTVDDELNIEKAHIKIYEKDGKLYGEVVQILREDHLEDKCDNCTDYRKGQPILGMEILSGLYKKKGYYTGGEILDPEKGKVYSCWIQMVNDDKLKVRGYVGVSALGRTQYWYRVK